LRCFYGGVQLVRRRNRTLSKGFLGSRIYYINQFTFGFEPFAVDVVFYYLQFSILLPHPPKRVRGFCFFENICKK